MSDNAPDILLNRKRLELRKAQQHAGILNSEVRRMEIDLELKKISGNIEASEKEIAAIDEQIKAMGATNG